MVSPSDVSRAWSLLKRQNRALLSESVSLHDTRATWLLGENSAQLPAMRGCVLLFAGDMELNGVMPKSTEGRKMEWVFIVLGLLLVSTIAFLVNLPFGLDGGPKPTQSKLASMFVRESVKVPFMVFRIHVGRFPTTEEGLDALIRCPRSCEGAWKGPYIETSVGNFPIDS